MLRPRFYMSAVWRYDPDKLAKIAIRVAPTLIIPAICDKLLATGPYRADVNYITADNFATISLRRTTDNKLVEALRAGFLNAYNPLQDQILGITSIYSDDPTPKFKDIIRAHDILIPAFNGIISQQETFAITRHNADKYMKFMRRILRGPSRHRDLSLRVEY